MNCAYYFFFPFFKGFLFVKLFGSTLNWSNDSIFLFPFDSHAVWFIEGIKYDDKGDDCEFEKSDWWLTFNCEIIVMWGNSNWIYDKFDNKR